MLKRCSDVIKFKLEDLGTRFLPGKILPHAQPLLAKADGILHGDTRDNDSQRIAIITFAIRVASALIALVSQILLARWLGTFEYGIFVAIWVALIILGTVTCLGYPSAIIRFIGEYQEKQQPEKVHGIIRASMLISLLASIAISSIGVFVLYSFPGLMEDYYIVPIFLAAFCLPMLSLEWVMNCIARAFEWPKTAFLPTYIFRPLGILFFVGLAFFLGFKPTAITTMYAAISACLISFLIQLVIIARKLKRVLPSVKPSYHLKYWTIVALPILLVEGFYSLMTSVDVLIVSALMSPQDTAIYFAATKILALVHFVYFAVRASVSHRYAAMHTQGDKEAFQAFVSKTVSWTFWPSVFMALVMALFGNLFLMLFGSEFTGASMVLYILLLGIVIRSSVGPCEALLVMSGSQKMCAMIYAITLTVNVTLNFTLIPVYGIIGAAIATAFALIFESTALYVATRRSLGLHAFIIPQKNDGEEKLA